MPIRLINEPGFKTVTEAKNNGGYKSNSLLLSGNNFCEKPQTQFTLRRPKRNE